MTEPQVSFAVFSKVWSDLPIAALAEHLAKMGFDAIELPVRKGAQVDPQRIEAELPQAVRILADHGLAIASVAGSLDERTIAACGQQGIPLIRAQIAVPKQGYLANEDEAKRLLTSLVPTLEKHGVAIGIQHHFGWNIPNALGLLHLIEGFDPRSVGAVWDPLHAALAGEEPEMGIDILWPYLQMVNLKNGFWEPTNGPEAPWAGWRNHMTTGDQGLASWPRAVAELRRRNYAGVVCLSAAYDDRSSAEADRLTPYDLALARSLFAMPLADLAKL